MSNRLNTLDLDNKFGYNPLNHQSKFLNITEDVVPMKEQFSAKSLDSILGISKVSSTATHAYATGDKND